MCLRPQGNGHENDKLRGVFRDAGVDVFTLDMFNAWIYPFDRAAEKAIDCAVRLKSGTGDEKYLSLLRSHLSVSLDSFRPQFVVYNAGTDCLAGDTLGQLDLSAAGIIERDSIVFRACRDRSIPTLMLLSGGYQKTNADVIARSIANLQDTMQLWQLDPKLAEAKTKGREEL
jgi:histone deacetylase 11